MRNTFKAYERLKREQHIDTLFRKGEAFSVFPIRFVYKIVPKSDEGSPVMAGFSIPKKKFKSSVHRHRIRRLMFEAWRLNKQELYLGMPEASQLHLFLIFMDNNMPEFDTVQAAVKKGIKKMAQLLNSSMAQ